MNKNYYCVIMAGGIGSRFWPLSRTDNPKQFLDILGTGKTLIQQTFDRFTKIIPPENILIVTNEDYKEQVLDQLPALKEDQVLLEPMRRNTAPCIAYANYKIKQKCENASIVVAPSDHLIENESAFQSVLAKGLEFVLQNSALLTLGIQPNRPETGYGYIQINGGKEPVELNKSLRKVKTFTEKPDIEMAKAFIESGDFFWNSGIFFWSLSSIMQAFNSYLPEINNLFNEVESSLNTPQEQEKINVTYSNCKNISIDYGIMEKAENVHVLCSDFGWSDLGTWGSLYERSTKDKYENSVQGETVFTYGVKNSIIKAPNNKLVVLQGLEDYIVVESDDVLLVCKKEEEQKIKQFVNDVKLKKGDSYV